MRQAWLVAMRDYKETVRSGSFLIMLLIVPLLLVLSIGVPILLERTAGPAKFVLVDLPEDWSARLQTIYDGDKADEIDKDLTLTIENTPAGRTADEHLELIQKRVRKKELYGYITLEALEGGDRTAAITTLTASPNDGLRWLKRNLPTIVRGDRAKRLGLSPEQVAALYAPVTIEDQVLPDVSGKAKAVTATDKLASFAPVIFTYLLWIVLFTLMQRLLMAIVEEKSNRSIEVLLSSVTPMEFMSGKVLAGVLEGVTVLGVWLGTLALFAGYITRTYLKGLDLTILFARKDHLAFFVIYFILGFVLFSSLTVGLGSLCNSIKETQNLMTPVMMLMIVPILVMTYVQDNPNSTLSVVLSFIPFFTPFLMMNRIAANPPPHVLEIVGATALLILSIWGTTWAGAKLFRIGVLMYGKPPKIGEVIKLLRSPAARVTAHHRPA